jgi:uncharacterized protein (TIGR02466 family)
MLDELQPWRYFDSPVYNFDKPEFLENAKTVLEENFNKVKETEKLNKIYPLFNTGSIHDDPRMENLVSYVVTMSHHILDSQGYDMNQYRMEIYDFWCQEHHTSSGHERHVHNSIISGFYFVSCPENSCRLIIHDPRQAKEYIQLIEKDPIEATYASASINFVPKEGQIIFTNSWLPHSFTRNESDQPFKMIHFNLGVIYTPQIISFTSNAEVV